MILSIILSAIFLAFILIITTLSIFIYKKNKKHFIIELCCSLLIFSLVFIGLNPIMHKPFSISFIDYIIKFNTDGSITTTKQTTTTVLKEDNN